MVERRRSEALDWVDVADLLRSTEARGLRQSGDEFSFSCHGPAHAHGDATPSAGMNARTTLWRCRSAACGLKGNAIDYLMTLKGLTRSEATRVLEERYGGPQRSVEAGALRAELSRRLSPAPVEPPRIAPSEEHYLAHFGLRWLSPLGSDGPLSGPMNYMLERGFSPQTLNRWGVGYDPLADRVTIPVYDEDGVLVGVKGRAWDGRQPRYVSIGDVGGASFSRYGFHTYHKSEYVFGLDVVRGRQAVLVEGELNVIALHQVGIPAVGVAGSEFSERQRALIVERLDEVVVYFDGDAAGAAGAERVVEMLSPYVALRVVHGAEHDAADAIDPRVEGFGEDDLRALIDGAEHWLVARLSRPRTEVE